MSTKKVTRASPPKTTVTIAKDAEAPKTPAVEAGSKSLPATPVQEKSVSAAKAKETPPTTASVKSLEKGSGAAPSPPASKDTAAKDKAAKEKAPASPATTPPKEGKGDGEAVPSILVQPPSPQEGKAKGTVAPEEKKEEKKETSKPLPEKESEKKPEETQKEIKPRPPLPKFAPVDMSSKISIRMGTWNRMESANLVLFPRPCMDRIPRFKGEMAAVEQLVKLDAFKEAKVVKVNLDKAHEKIRLGVIEHGKELVAGSPGLRDAVFLVVHPPMAPGRASNQKAASRMGIQYYGTALEFLTKKIDLVVMGSVAVDLKGRRVGKGEGFSDLEFALLANRGSITSDVTIVTLVHDAQVFDEFPDSIFKPYDVHVDIIITPTRVIHIENRLDRPSLNWEFLSKRRVDRVPILQLILDQEQANGNKVELKDQDSESEEGHRRLIPMRSRRPRYGTPRRRQLSASEPRGQRRVAAGGRPRRESKSGGEEPRMLPNQRRGAPTRTFTRRIRRTTSTSVGSTKSEGQARNDRSRRGQLRRRISRPRCTIDFSVKVSGLTNSVRIRDLKAALVERDVRPRDISWRATKGVALLHFAKSKQLPAPGATPVLPKGPEEVITCLRNLSVKPEDGPSMNLNVEVAQPLIGAKKQPPMTGGQQPPMTLIA